MEKGDENEKLVEKVTEIKNHYLSQQIIGQKFLVKKIGTLN